MQQPIIAAIVTPAYALPLSELLSQMIYFNRCIESHYVNGLSAKSTSFYIDRYGKLKVHCIFNIIYFCISNNTILHEKCKLNFNNIFIIVMLSTWVLIHLFYIHSSYFFKYFSHFSNCKY